MTFSEAFNDILVARNGKITMKTMKENEYIFIQCDIRGRNCLFSNISGKIDNETTIDWFWSNCNGWKEYNEPLLFSVDLKYKTINDLMAKIFILNDGSGYMLGAIQNGIHWHPTVWDKNGECCSPAKEFSIINYWN